MTNLEKLQRLTRQFDEDSRRPSGRWIWDIKGECLLWTPPIFEIFGVTVKDFGGTYESFLETVHPEDRQFVKDAVDRALNESESYDINHRIVLPDGIVKTVREVAEVFFNSDGNPLRMEGTVRDITNNGTE